ncbi:MAG: hypothetical protein ACHQ5A_11480 [Opitutales bacterium]
MKAPSRFMPASPELPKATIVTWVFLAGLIGCLVWGGVVSLPLRWSLGGTFALMAVLTVIHRMRLKRIREARLEESICTFARALPAKAHDTWIVRAIYEEIFQEVGVPIRPADKIEKFWGIVGDDLDDVICRIAHRAGRSMDDTQKNPFYGKVVSVADMVAFIEHQPKLPNASPQQIPPTGG